MTNAETRVQLLYNKVTKDLTLEEHIAAAERLANYFNAMADSCKAQIDLAAGSGRASELRIGPEGVGAEEVEELDPDFEVKE